MLYFFHLFPLCIFLFCVFFFIFFNFFIFQFLYIKIFFFSNSILFQEVHDIILSQYWASKDQVSMQKYANSPERLPLAYTTYCVDVDEDSF